VVGTVGFHQESGAGQFVRRPSFGGIQIFQNSLKRSGTPASEVFPTFSGVLRQGEVYTIFFLHERELP
jgi:hypothetical protein